MELLHFDLLCSKLKQSYSSYVRKVLVFQKSCFKVKVLKTFQIPSDYHIKTCGSLKWSAFLNP